MSKFTGEYSEYWNNKFKDELYDLYRKYDAFPGNIEKDIRLLSKATEMFKLLKEMPNLSFSTKDVEDYTKWDNKRLQLIKEIEG